MFKLNNIEGKNADLKPTYIPLLTNEQIITEDFQNKLNALKKNKNNTQSQKKQGAKNSMNKKKNSMAVEQDDEQKFIKSLYNFVINNYLNCKYLYII